MDKEKVLTLLNKALSMEYADVFLYQRHVDYFKNYPGLGDLFKNFSQMENKHADILSKEILRLGGEPVLNIQIPAGRKDIREIVRFHLANEEGAIEHYRRCSSLIDTDDRLKDLIDKIRIEEAIHAAALKQLLKLK